MIYRYIFTDKLIVWKIIYDLLSQNNILQTNRKYMKHTMRIPWETESVYRLYTYREKSDLLIHVEQSLLSLLFYFFMVFIVWRLQYCDCKRSHGGNMLQTFMIVTQVKLSPGSVFTLCGTYYSAVSHKHIPYHIPYTYERVCPRLCADPLHSFALYIRAFINVINCL